MSQLRRVLLCFAQDNVEFRRPEIESLIKLFKLDVKVPSVCKKPYWIVENVTESDLKKIASRSLSLRYAAEIWSDATTYDAFHDKLKTYTGTLEQSVKQSSFRITVDTYNKKIKHAEKIQRIESMDYLPLQGTIDLTNPDINFMYFEFWGLDPNNVAPEPEEIFFGRWIVDGQREIVNSISLRTRKFIGNTSMNPALSLLMANQGLCDKNQLMFDPFAGTGSLMVSAAKFGSYVIGSDIDYQMLHGKTKPTRVKQKVREKDESIKANLIQYGLQHLYLDVFVGDFSNCPFSDSIQFDSIITDPPYGIREAVEQIVSKESKKTTVLSEDAVHYPSTSSYSLKRMFDDLLIFSVKYLKPGGRLVCWFPVSLKDYHEKLLPQHSALELVANSEQKLNGGATRRLLTYEKISEAGEIVDSGLDEIDFRTKYFASHGTPAEKLERRMARYEQNMQEALKRGKPFENILEMKRLRNKKLLLERE